MAQWLDCASSVTLQWVRDVSSWQSATTVLGANFTQNICRQRDTPVRDVSRWQSVTTALGGTFDASVTLQWVRDVSSWQSATTTLDANIWHLVRTHKSVYVMRGLCYYWKGERSQSRWCSGWHIRQWEGKYWVHISIPPAPTQSRFVKIQRVDMSPLHPLLFH